MTNKDAMRCIVIDFSEDLTPLSITTYIIPESIPRDEVEEFVFNNTDHKRSSCQWICGRNLVIGFKTLMDPNFNHEENTIKKGV